MRAHPTSRMTSPDQSGATSLSPQPFAYRNLPMLLLRARERLMVRFRPILSAHGLTEQQWRVIRALNEQGPMESRHVASLCTISTPSLVGILVRMQRAGLVRKSHVARDRRRVIVTLTPRSVRLIRNIAGELQAVYIELERTLGHATLMAAYEAVDALLGDMESRDRPRSHP